MRIRPWPLWSGLLALALPPTAPAAPPAPTVVVRAESLDHLLEDFQHLATAAGQEEVGRQAAGMFQALGGGAGSLAGFDTRKPFGLYAVLTQVPTDSPVVLLLPVADQDAVLTLLKQQLGLDPKKGEDGIYSVSVPNVPRTVYFRFANKYAYVTAVNKDALATDKLVAPEQVVSGGEGLASLSLHFDRIPEGYKQIVVTQLELRLADFKGQRAPGETDAQTALKGKILDHLVGVVKGLLTEGAELRVTVRLDRDKGEASLEARLQGRGGTKLASELAALGRATSLFAGRLGDALSLGMTLGLPEAVRHALEPVIDEAIAKALASQADPNQRQLAEQALKALAPTLKSGELDAGLALRGPDSEGLFTLVVGARLVEGQRLDKVLRDVVAVLPEQDRAKVTLDAAKAGGHPIHRLDVGAQLDADVRRLFGEGGLFLGIRPDALVLALGPGGEKAVREVLTAEPQAAAPARASATISRLVKAVPPSNPSRKAALEVFTGPAADAQATLRLTAGPDGLALRVSVPSLVLKWGARIDAQKKAAEKP